jgi:hypothetical protein
MPPITKPKRQVNLFRILLSGVAAGLSSSFICLFYKWVFTHYTGFQLAEFVNAYYIVLACMLGAMLAAMGYYALSLVMSKPAMLYVFIVFILLLLSLFAPLSPTLPDETTAPNDFTLLTLPMHVFTGLIITYLIPTIAGPPKLIYKN